MKIKLELTNSMAIQDMDKFCEAMYDVFTEEDHTLIAFGMFPKEKMDFIESAMKSAMIKRYTESIDMSMTEEEFLDIQRQTREGKKEIKYKEDIIFTFKPETINSIMNRIAVSLMTVAKKRGKMVV